MKSSEVIKKFQDKDKFDLCCSESIFYAANEYYDLNLHKDTLKVSSAFCGGNGVESTCGLLSASIMVIALLTNDSVAHQNPHTKAYIIEFTDLFNNKFKSDICRDLKKVYRSEQFGCKELIIEAFILLCDFIDHEILKNKVKHEVLL